VASHSSCDRGPWQSSSQVGEKPCPGLAPGWSEAICPNAGAVRPGQSPSARYSSTHSSGTRDGTFEADRESSLGISASVTPKSTNARTATRRSVTVLSRPGRGTMAPREPVRSGPGSRSPRSVSPVPLSHHRLPPSSPTAGDSIWAPICDDEPVDESPPGAVNRIPLRHRHAPVRAEGRRR
jgi:hypothetical protein